MTIPNSKLTENKFNQIKSGLSAAEITDSHHFYELSKLYESDDLDLSYRLLEHAYRLDPKSPSIKTRLITLRRLKQDLNDKLTLEQIDNVIDEEERKISASKRETTKIGSISLEYLERKLSNIPSFFKSSIFIFVLLPWVLYAFYLSVLASHRFESQSQIIIKQPDSAATMDPTMAVLTGLGVPAVSNDTQIIKAYILSADMLEYLETELALKKHYASGSIDVFSRLSSDATFEEFIKFYNAHILVEVDDISSVISVKAQAFESSFAQSLNKLILDRAEWFINSIGHKLAQEQLKFINAEHENVVNKLETAKRSLLSFQRENKLLDAEVEGAAFQQIAYSLESQLSLKKAELKSLLASMSNKSPQVLAIKDTISALESQLKEENNRLSGGQGDNNVAKKLTQFADYKIDLELALQAYSSSLISLEKSRIEAYRKLQYLVTVESPTLPEDYQYPNIVYNLCLLALILLLMFGISKVLIATSRELN